LLLDQASCIRPAEINLRTYWRVTEWNILYLAKIIFHGKIGLCKSAKLQRYLKLYLIFCIFVTALLKRLMAVPRSKNLDANTAKGTNDEKVRFIRLKHTFLICTMEEI